MYVGRCRSVQVFVFSSIVASVDNVSIKAAVFISRLDLLKRRKISSAGAATSIIFVQTEVLSRQAYFRRDKGRVCHDKNYTCGSSRS